MRILRSPCDAKQRSEPNRGEVWRLRHTGVGTATPLTPEQCCKQVEFYVGVLTWTLLCVLCVKQCRCEANAT
eukprot:scaffold3131_cov106-Skeletonema_dohrnii-CCMP3373.AAC.1